jgi:ubiquinone/menaquinone biosynthesis C-methylase UbiE
MKDALGRSLMLWRVHVVLPHVRGRLLDVACGTNELVKAYGGFGIGVDVHPWEGVHCVADASAGLPFRDGTFGTVSIVAALNHIVARDAALAEARRVLEPGGRLVLTMIPQGVSTVWHFLRRRSDADQVERGMRPGETYGLASSEVRRLIEGAGLEVIIEQRFMLGINRLSVASAPLRQASSAPALSRPA